MSVIKTLEEHGETPFEVLSDLIGVDDYLSFQVKLDRLIEEGKITKRENEDGRIVYDVNGRSGTPIR
ncbi:hypothetical protein IMZ31_23535 (plasmid) [Pontibacillus sp. ALD_SL1]|uniref:hypothetical protein n=1 Tax=Pontibacillus sp. ALD_SL1 TaxID=2777185 RepID=UPI001A956F6F|nr:hypothetical protein [Pontibacillus sp. ALD_SL1]QST02425.1 hypothetical protein IMZ31_23535 [Pontibacillus sp. ALD_SL1]